MNRIEKLISQYPDVYFEFEKMPNDYLGGLTIGNEIIINSNHDEERQYQWLCEELGHYELSIGDIIDYSSTKNMKQEYKARKIGMQKCVPKEKLVQLINKVPENDYEVAEELGVKIDYLHSVVNMYRLKRMY